MNNSNFDRLLDYMENRAVIPIIGQELLVLKRNGTEINAPQCLARELAARFEITADRLPQDYTLSQVIAAAPGFPEDRPYIYSRAHSIFRELHSSVAVPEPLVQLAHISAFKLYLTTTFDPWLSDALRLVRGADRHKPLVIPHQLRTDGVPPDLPSDWDLPSRPIIYQMFGGICPETYYALTEEDQLECICKLQKDPPQILCDVLREKNLLFIGNSFSDWLARFFIRTVRGERILTEKAKRRDVFVVDNELQRSMSLASFLTGFGHDKPFAVPPAAEFIRELHCRWLKRHPEDGNWDKGGQDTAPPPSPSERYDVFISYAHEDKNMAQKLCEALSQDGMSVWFDKAGGLNPGDPFEENIRWHIAHCRLFAPVLSSQIENRWEGFFRKEWKWALKRNEGLSPNCPFIMPVVVDPNFQIQSSREVPREFKSFSAMIANGGNISPDDIRIFRKKLDLARKTENGR